MNKISIVMPVYNAEDHISESVKSILRQTYDNFELIIIDDGSTDKCVEIIQSFQDDRIKLFQNPHHFINSLNRGLEQASGKYIVRMDADDIMHIDRLKIQHALMEEEPEITVCGSSMIPFGDNIKPGDINYSGNGLIEFPLIKLLVGNIIFHPTTMIRTAFLKKHKLHYENYLYAEDYKLWFEVAKRGGIFFVESQPLLFYRISKSQISNSHADKQDKIHLKIVREILSYLIELNKENYPEISSLYEMMFFLEEKELTDLRNTANYFYKFFRINKNKLNIL